MDQIAAWLEDRLTGVERRAICRVEGAPGYGKSWTLERFVAQHQARLGSAVYLFGPLMLETPPTPGWFHAQTEQFLRRPYAFKARYDPDAHFVNHLVALVEDLEQLDPPPHLLVIVDDVDQVSDLAEAEEKFLGPLVSLSRRHAVSLLLALRSEFGFQRVEELRQRDKYALVRLGGFDEDQAMRQLELLIERHAASSANPLFHGSARDLAGRMYESLHPYRWGIPALNAELCSVFAAKAGGNITWTAEEQDQCILLAWRLDPASEQDRQFLAAIKRLHVAHPERWTVDHLGRALNLPLHEAARFRNRLQRLNLIERPPGAALGTYCFSAHWKDLLRAASAVAIP